MRAAATTYKTPDSTVDAFWYVVKYSGMGPEYLTAWLLRHPMEDRQLLITLYLDRYGNGVWHEQT